MTIITRVILYSHRSMTVLLNFLYSIQTICSETDSSTTTSKAVFSSLMIKSIFVMSGLCGCLCNSRHWLLSWWWIDIDKTLNDRFAFFRSSFSSHSFSFSFHRIYAETILQNVHHYYKGCDSAHSNDSNIGKWCCHNLINNQCRGFCLAILTNIAIETFARIVE